MRNRKKYIVVSIIDDGPGIDDKIKATIFDPFVTTSSDSLNTGLGIVDYQKNLRKYEWRY